MLTYILSLIITGCIVFICVTLLRLGGKKDE